MDSTSEFLELIRGSKDPEKAAEVAITAIRQFLSCCEKTPAAQAASLEEQDEEAE